MKWTLFYKRPHFIYHQNSVILTCLVLATLHKRFNAAIHFIPYQSKCLMCRVYFQNSYRSVAKCVHTNQSLFLCTHFNLNVQYLIIFLYTTELYMCVHCTTDIPWFSLHLCVQYTCTASYKRLWLLFIIA